jgi:type VII secretion protein EccB
MATARDQVEAYNFASRRQVLALLQGDDAVTVDPRRRLNRALIGGLLLSVAVVAATGVAGFISGGSATSVPSDGVIVDSDTGGSYVRINDVLHPALNIASARLIAGNKSTTVSSDTLRSLPRGLPVGIPGAPDSLPPSGQLTTQPWSVCSIAAEASAARPQVVVSIGAPTPRALPASAGLVVQTPDKTIWLLDNGLRYQVEDAASTLLGLDQLLPLQVRPEVLDLVPQGPSLAVPAIPGAGAPPTVTLPFTADVGDLVKVDYGTKQPGLYVVLSDGVAPVDAFAYSLLAGGAKHTLTEPASDIVSVPSKSRPSIPALWPRQALGRPAAPPAADEPLCITYNPNAPHTAAAWPVTFSEPPAVPFAKDATPVEPSGGSLPTAATGVAVPSGGGALVKAVATGGVDAVYTLVTDSGLRFTITNADAVSRLGYDSKTAVPVPLPFVELLPAGPGLDPTAAGAEYGGAAQAPSATATGSAPDAPDAPDDSGAPPS